jgi:hypothetical protein
MVVIIRLYPRIKYGQATNPVLFPKLSILDSPILQRVQVCKLEPAEYYALHEITDAMTMSCPGHQITTEPEYCG